MNAACWMAALRAAMTAIAFVIILAPIVVVVLAAFSPTDFFVFLRVIWPKFIWTKHRFSTKKSIDFFIREFLKNMNDIKVF